MPAAVWFNDQAERGLFPSAEVRATPTFDGIHDSMEDLENMVYAAAAVFEWGLSDLSYVIAMGSLWITPLDPEQFSGESCATYIDSQ
jgi:hypothetical protein